MPIPSSGAVIGAMQPIAVTSSTFTPTHTYYISTSGSNSNSGSSSSPWATPNHAVNCGDVILVAAGSYTNQFQDGKWGTVSNCPSTTGGIDGTGGVYFATVLCEGPNMSSCAINGTTAEAVRVNTSHWAVEGFTATTNTTSGAGCFAYGTDTTADTAYIAFINNIASTCGVQGFGGFGSPGGYGADMLAVVGGISWNAAPSSGAGVCGSGVSMIPYENPAQTGAGTHVFVAGTFDYDNINAPTGAGCNTDGEGIVFDSWSCQGPYTHQGVMEQNVVWGNGSDGYEIFPNCTGNGDYVQGYVFSNTSYGNEQDPQHGRTNLKPTSAIGNGTTTTFSGWSG